MKKADSSYYKLSFCDNLEGLYLARQTSAFPFHLHPTYNISLIYTGTFQTRLQDRQLGAVAGSLVITNPQEIHANPVDASGMVSLFTFYVSGDLLTYLNNGIAPPLSAECP